MKFTLIESLSELPAGDCTIVQKSSKSRESLLIIEKMGERFETVKELNFRKKELNVHGFLLPVYVFSNAEKAFKNYLNL